ncbi:hypothetical protein HDU91_007256 [Kappamyces sp. JEL0680]|nr:hypothetical protein HDU91_007256 [Kappamyces sp. JEL0680]
MNRFLASAVVYLIIVRILRYRNRSKHAAVALPMSLATAIEINQRLAKSEFPLMTVKSLEFALFKTYAIPSISGILAKTKELLATDLVPKRVDDTDLLIRELTTHPMVTSVEHESMDPLQFQRGDWAIRRLNHIHSQYPILNDDMIYTLALFVLEPIDHINRLEWRQLLAVEEEAGFQQWLAIGKEMGIKDIPPTLRDLAAFKDAYESKYMVLHANNQKVAEATTNFFIRKVPRFLKPFARQIIYCLISPRLAKAVGYPAPHWLLKTLVFALLKVRALFIRYCMLPRIFSAERLAARPDPATGLFVPRTHPYGETYRHGYAIQNLGPSHYQPGEIMTACPVYRNRPVKTGE